MEYTNFVLLRPLAVPQSPESPQPPFPTTVGTANTTLTVAIAFLRVIAECFARLSHGLGVRLYVRHTAVLMCQNGAS